MEKLYISPFNFNGIILYYEMQRKGMKIEGFLESNSYLWNKSYAGVGIYQRCYIPNSRIIVCANKTNTRMAIRNHLLEMGYENDKIEQLHYSVDILNVFEDILIDDLLKIFPKTNNALMCWIENVIKLKKMKEENIDVRKISYEDLFDLNRKEVFDDKIFLKQCEIIVTNKCSLKCKKCAAGIQYFEHPQDMEYSQVIKDYNKMIELIDWIDDIVIIGGEPFLYDDLDKVIDGIFNNPQTKKKVGVIKIITNGTVIPNNKVLQAIKKNKIIIWISNYGDKSRKLGELINILRQERIDYTVLPLQKWSDVIQLNNEKTIQEDAKRLKRRKDGCVTRCRTVAGGRFYLCSLLKSMDFLGIKPFGSGDYVDLYEDDARTKIMRMLDMNTPLPRACSFCSGCSKVDWDNASIKVAEQISRPLNFIKTRD